MQPPQLKARFKKDEGNAQEGKEQGEPEKISFLHGEEKGTTKSELERTVTLGAKSVTTKTLGIQA